MSVSVRVRGVLSNSNLQSGRDERTHKHTTHFIGFRHLVFWCLELFQSFASSQELYNRCKKIEQLDALQHNGMTN